jgi:site-specific recombinase XerD
LHNIEWKNKKIVLIQKKTKQTLELPLLDDIGWALIDYLKNGRPKTKSDSVFINHKAPYGEFKDTNGMQHILWNYMSVAGLERPKNEHCGLHSLRSTLARTMLEVGTPLPTISEVLGHESIQTASIYLKINLEALRKCPIDPEEVFLHEQ